MTATNINVHPIHLGLGATAEIEPEFTGGMEWYGRSQAESIRVVDRATGGGQTCNDLAPGCAGGKAHAGRARQRTCPSRSA